MLGNQFDSLLVPLLEAVLETRKSLRVFDSPPNAGTTASEGNRANVSTSSGVFTVLSRYSRSNASPTPPTRPTRKARAILRVFAGREGVEGTIAGSTILILEDLRPEEICASFSLVSKLSYSVLFASASRFKNVVLDHLLRHCIDFGFCWSRRCPRGLRVVWLLDIRS